MKTHATSHPPLAVVRPDRGLFEGLLRFVSDRFLLLPFGALVALVWANTAPETYFRFAHLMAFPVNEIAMAFFLALLAQEVLESFMPGGALHTWRRWSTPLIAAAGGVAGAAGVYVLYVQLKHEPMLLHGWPVACAIDAAAGYYVLKAIWRRSSAFPFLLLTALATDAFGLIVVGLRSTTPIPNPITLLLLFAAFATAVLLRQLRVVSFWPYFALAGTLSWFALYRQGIHPALALLPIVPFLPRVPRPQEPFANGRHDDEVLHFEHEWNDLVQVILLLFGLVNAGVILKDHGTGTWAVLTAALVGRPLGIMAAAGLAVAAGLRLPRGIGWRELLVTALATSSGFTFALFFAVSVVPIGPVLSELRFGALATVAGALLTLVAAALLARGRRTG